MSDPHIRPTPGRHRLAPARHRFACPPRRRVGLGVRRPAAALSVVSVAVALALVPHSAGSPSGMLPAAGAVFPWLAPSEASAAEPEREPLRASVPVRVARSTPERWQTLTVDNRRPQPALPPRPSGGPPPVDDPPDADGPPATTGPPTPDTGPGVPPVPTEDADPGPEPDPDDTPEPAPDPQPEPEPDPEPDPEPAPEPPSCQPTEETP